MMIGKELDDLIRENYKKANTEYLLKQTREAVAIHAHWYYDPDKPPVGCRATTGGMFCSNCGGDCPTGSHPYREFKYCPYCGARMDDVTE